MLQSNQSLINLGDIRQGSQINHQFILKNTYPCSITITGVGASCGCTKPLISKLGSIDSNEEVVITIVADTTGRSGLFSKTIYVHYVENNVNKTFSQSFKANIIL